MKYQLRRVVAAIFILSSLVFAVAFLPLSYAQDGEAMEKPAGMNFSYNFENSRFYIPLIEIDIAADGSGELRFKRGESDDILDRKLTLRPQTLSRIRHLVEASGFLTSDEDYQYKKDFSNLGWITVTARQGERERKARFNYTTHPEIKELADIFRAIATQEIHLFDIDLSQQFQPLDLPRQLDSLENDLKNERVAEPEKLLEMLRDIAGNDVMLLNARRRAKSIIESIEKKKYKTPVKTK